MFKFLTNALKAVAEYNPNKIPELTGIKIVFNNKVDFDKAKKIFEYVKKEMSSTCEYGYEYEVLHSIYKTRLGNTIEIIRSDIHSEEISGFASPTIDQLKVAYSKACKFPDSYKILCYDKQEINLEPEEI